MTTRHPTMSEGFMPDGFDGFDDVDVPTKPVSGAAAQWNKLRSELRESPEFISASRVLKPKGVSLVVDKRLQVWKDAWAAEIIAKNRSDAERVGQAIQEDLIAASKLDSSTHRLHEIPLIVVWEEGYVELPPLEKKVKVRTEPSLSDEKQRIIKKGEFFFGVGGFSISGSNGKYTGVIRPVLKRFKSLFRESTFRGATLQEIDAKLVEAMAKVSLLLNNTK